MLTSIRNPRRRAISVGPQSEADAYETLAYREKRRRDSTSADGARHLHKPIFERSSNSDSAPAIPRLAKKTSRSPVRTPSKLNEYENMMGTGTPVSGGEPELSSKNTPKVVVEDVSNKLDNEVKAQDEEDMFSKITRPRVRYDVEVVTKLIVYSGGCFFFFFLNSLISFLSFPSSTNSIEQELRG